MAKNLLDPTKWIDKYADYLYNYTIVRVNDDEVAKDIISETFLAGLQSKDNFKGEASERTWLISILKRKIIDHYRKSNSRKGKAEVRMFFTNEDGEDENWIEQQVSDPYERNAQETMENSELGISILECLEKLSPKHAAVFKMKTIDNFDTEAICNEFNITPSNLWVIIHRARTAMADCLKQNWF
jgi:RNA polymerase sigma-70 factor (ECF subfamily)